MAGKIVIDTKRCKGCGLCITVCPQHNLEISTESNQSGYFPARVTNTGCTACSRCAIICPEGIIEITREDANHVRIVAAAGTKNAADLIEKKQ